jgi:hypothetical protein
MKTNSVKTIRIIARVMSAIIVAFALIMFIGETMESAKRTPHSPMTLYTIIQLALFAIGLISLALAWKWEFIGGIISLIAFLAIFIVNPSALLWPMFIFPANAILFIAAAYFNKALNQKT